MRLIFQGVTPSRDGTTAPTDQCIMRKYNLSEVTPQMIAYAAVLVCEYF